MKVIVYFDEAHDLTKCAPWKRPDNKTIYDILCTCFNAFLADPIFFIFLSTKPDIEQLAPSAEMASSAHAHMNADVLQAPITETPFRCPKLSIRPGQYTLEQICTVELCLSLEDSCNTFTAGTLYPQRLMLFSDSGRSSKAAPGALESSTLQEPS